MSATKQNNTSETEVKILTTPIAIIGMASLFPEAKDLSSFWENIQAKLDCIIDVPPDRWNIDDYYDPDPNTPDKTYNKRGGFIPAIDFDPMEFGLPPNILEVTDVAQLLALVVAKDAMEDAGYSGGREFARDRTGVILGMIGIGSKLFQPLMSRLQYPVWEKVLLNSGVSAENTTRIIDAIKKAYVGWEENAFPGVIGNVVAGRIANRLDLGGINCTVDAACATGLAAVRMAISELIERRVDMMITGAVDTDNSISTYLSFSKTPAFTKGDRVRPFDAESDGIMVGEGIGMVVLKRLEDAERDGDHIYAVIRGAGASSDGRFKSIYAPRSDGQAMALSRAYQEAGFPPHTIGLMEAHGTGTMAGDPAEFQGLRQVFSENNPERQHIALGSIKSQIGHTKAAAGIASMIKAALALHHKILPPTINVKQPNSVLDIENSPFYLNTETRPWFQPVNGMPRRAGISSFGFGGTNFHMVLEEYQPEHQSAYRVHSVPQAVILSARDTPALLEEGQRWLQQLEGEDGAKAHFELMQTSSSAVIPEAHVRLGFLSKTIEDTRQQLRLAMDYLKANTDKDGWEHPKGIYYQKRGINADDKLVALFPGQGSQYLEMGKEAVNNFPPLRQTLSRTDRIMIEDGAEALTSVLFPPPVFNEQDRSQLEQRLQNTRFAQPALGSVSMGFYKLLLQSGFTPNFIAGHSFGELTALWAGGVYEDDGFLRLAFERGKAMSPPDDPDFDAGTMLAVKGELAKLEVILPEHPEVTLANRNSNNQVVLAGAKADIERIRSVLAEQGFTVIPLSVSAAFHTKLVKHAQRPFAKAIKATLFNPPRVPVFSNTSAEPYPADPQAIQKMLTEHILNPVLFKDTIENLHQAGGRVFVEVGPKNVLTNLVKNILAGKPHYAIALNPNAKKDADLQLREAVLQLRLLGLDLRAFDPYQPEQEAPSTKKKSPVTVRLNGGLYVSEKTKKGFEEALKVTANLLVGSQRPAVESQTAPAVTQAAAALPQAVESSPAKELVPQPEAHEKVIYTDGAGFEMLEQTVLHFQRLQEQVLNAHTHYLQNEAEYSRLFSQLNQSILETVQESYRNPTSLKQADWVAENLETSLARLHEHQDQTGRVHESYLQNQAELSQRLIDLLETRLGKSPVRTSHSATISKMPSLAAVPEEKLAWVTAIENGAHIAATAQPHPPHLTSPPSAADHGNGRKTSPAPETPPPSAPPAEAVSPASAAVSAEGVNLTFMRIVSEKTGYPQETLEAGMDMEADLGIDSIKRVEILGAVREVYPDLPRLTPEQLVELRTLGQIADHIVTHLPANGHPSPQAPAPAVADSGAAASAPAVSQQPSPSVSPPVPAASGAVEDLERQFFSIVSEKTGYPQETLEADMDMEADLGIDSIKRVEILGALREFYPDMPRLTPEQMVELRTMGQIVEALRSHLSGGQTAAPAAPPASVPEPARPAVALPGQQTPAATPLPDAGALKDTFFEIVSEKTGYPVETLEAGMDMEADLGIDSIKRVEILGAMREQYPDMPRLSPEQLVELRTLGQIVDFIGSSQSGGTTQPAQAEPAALPAGAAEIPARPVKIKSLPAPDRLEKVYDPSSVYLVTDDGTAITTGVCQSLKQAGVNVAVLNWPKTVLPSQAELPQDVVRFALDDTGEEALQKTLQTIAARTGQITGFIHLAPPAAATKERDLTKAVFLLAKHLKPALTTPAPKTRPVFMAVVHLDGKFGLDGSADFSAESGGVLGLVKSLNLEWDSVFCRGLDLSPQLEAQEAARIIIDELHDPNELIGEVGHSPKGRWTLTV